MGTVRLFARVRRHKGVACGGSRVHLSDNQNHSVANDRMTMILGLTDKIRPIPRTRARLQEYCVKIAESKSPLTFVEKGVAED